MKLKFRVWEGEKYLSLSKALKEGLVGVQYDRDNSFELESYYEHVTIEMFTGLKDKNGVEIFEGDLLKSYDEHGNIDVDKVIYNTSHCKFMLVSDSESRLPIGLGEYSSFTLEVIGNIHEVSNETTM